MSYCVGILVNDGLFMASDSRTNAGVDRVATFSKMFTFERPGERVFVLLTAGNLSITQSAVSVLLESIQGRNEHPSLLKAESMYQAAKVVGNALREVYRADGPTLERQHIDFYASMILGGQIKGGDMKLFEIYAAGNFIEATEQTPYFQIGEVKYAKPVIDRLITQETSLADAAKCALISFDSTMRSNISVGPPIDVALCRRGHCRVSRQVRIEASDPYLVGLRDIWTDGLRKVFNEVPSPEWTS